MGFIRLEVAEGKCVVNLNGSQLCRLWFLSLAYYLPID
jgi:hypothetical protein